MNYLQRYQQLLGLNPDGVIGPNTASAMMKDLGITNKLLFAHAMGQAQHESANWTFFRENLNYSYDKLLKIFKKYYDSPLAQAHANKPVLIGNHVYANRLGNGPESSGDGYRNRGIFGLQLTGATNIKKFFKSIGVPENTDPDSLKDDVRAYFKAIFFWFKDNDAERYCTDTSLSTIDKVGKKVNRGNVLSTTPLALNNKERRKYTLNMFKALKL
jgi:putative chitinase